MTIGYLHMGTPTHGVARYGRVLAAAAREHLDAAVLEAEARVDGPGRDADEQLRRAADALTAADVVHLQYNERVWGNARSAALVRTFLEAYSVPTVVTLHDVRRGYGWRGIGRRLLAKRRASVDGVSARSDGGQDDARRSGGWLASLQRAARYVWKERQNMRATRLLGRRAGRLLVCTNEEARRLCRIVPGDRLAVIPHFVEARPMEETPEAAKAALDLTGRRVCTVLGFIHRAKGHALVIEALPQWPDNVQVVFAGRAANGSEGFVAQLQARARALGVAGRLRITGYLADAELNRYLAATDVALCPFEQVSASGSLSTWIAAERPVLASDQPQMAECNAIAPGAIATFSPYTPDALVRATCALLEGKAKDSRPARTRLRERLSLPRIMQQHAAVYRHVAAHNAVTST